MTSIPVDTSPTAEELRAEVHQLVDRLVQVARDAWGPIPAVGSGRWWTAPVQVQLAALCILGEAYLESDHERLAVQMLKDAAGDLSKARRWSDAARLPSHSELMRRRYPPTGDRDLWVRYGPAGPPKGAAA